ncbi:hypothetical protein [Sphaerisporangium perillae]|uniref:hypothetical protein n=1 Tax=Sphaerisporangium perillae TaxID=2935860 RepID=UPI00200DEAC2|nr:hypothetical protein [Sphaerisporangium perillae]
MTDFTAHAAATTLGAAAPATPVGPGLLGFLVVAAIGVALYFLVKSMNRQMSKIEVPHEADLDKPGHAETPGSTPRADGSH